jgi:hypothetical protein
MNTNSPLKQYLREIRNLLPCDSAQKKRYIAGLNESIQPYIQEHPDTTLDTLYSIFGTPGSIAEDYLNNADALDISRRVSKKRIIILGLVILVAVVIIIGSVAIRIACDVNEIHKGHFTEYIGYSTETAPPLTSDVEVY